MIDFIKIVLKNVSSEVLELNTLLTFCDNNLNATTGELRERNKSGNKSIAFKNAYYKGLEFAIYSSGTITLEGSIHKYWNNGAHNYNDFGRQQINAVLKDLEEKFGILPQHCILRQLEIGVNILPPIATNEIINHCFLHSTTPFQVIFNSDEGKYIQAVHSQFFIKLYNKKLHYQKKGFNIEQETLRFEIKYRKMKKLNKIGIYNLQELIEYGVQNFKSNLLDEWSKILFFDKSINHNSSRLVNYKNPLYWQELTNRKNNSSFNKHKKILREITSHYSQNIQNEVYKIIAQKVDELFPRGSQIDGLYIQSIPTPPNSINKDNVCAVTGLNISMQKKGSILISHTGLKYYFKTDKKIFEELKRKYLSIKWRASDYKTQIKELAHNIRNTKCNRTNKISKQYPVHQKNLLSALNEV